MPRPVLEEARGMCLAIDQEELQAFQASMPIPAPQDGADNHADPAESAPAWNRRQAVAEEGGNQPSKLESQSSMSFEEMAAAFLTKTG